MDNLKEFLLSVLSSLVAAAILASATPVSRVLISLAVLRISPRERDRFREEWRAHLNETDGAFGKLGHALACVFIAAKLDRELRSRNSLGQETQFSKAHSGHAVRGWSRKALSGLASAAMTILWLLSSYPSLRTFPPSDPVLTQFPSNGTRPLQYLPPSTSSWPPPLATEYVPSTTPRRPSNDDAPAQSPALALSSSPYRVI